jgi:hypothetical protein
MSETLMQQGAVIAVVGAAVLYLARQTWRTLRQRAPQGPGPGGCDAGGCGCGK